MKIMTKNPFIEFRKLSNQMKSIALAQAGVKNIGSFNSEKTLNAYANNTIGKLKEESQKLREYLNDDDYLKQLKNNYKNRMKTLGQIIEHLKGEIEKVDEKITQHERWAEEAKLDALGLNIDQEESTRPSVTLDGANLIHSGLNGEMNGGQLIDAISFYENKGYTVHACLKSGTYHYMGIKKAKGLKQIEKYVKSGKIKIFNAKKEDVFIIKTALKHDSWLVTHDTFKRQDEETGLSEREKFPKLDWSRIDKIIRGKDHWQIVDGNFTDPSIGHALYENNHQKEFIDNISKTINALTRLEISSKDTELEKSQINMIKKAVSEINKLNNSISQN